MGIYLESFVCSTSISQCERLVAGLIQSWWRSGGVQERQQWIYSSCVCLFIYESCLLQTVTFLSHSLQYFRYAYFCHELFSSIFLPLQHYNKKILLGCVCVCVKDCNLEFNVCELSKISQSVIISFRVWLLGFWGLVSSKLRWYIFNANLISTCTKTLTFASNIIKWDFVRDYKAQIDQIKFE